MTFSKKDTQHNKIAINSKCLYAECRDLSIAMLNVVMLSVVMLNVVAPGWVGVMSQWVHIHKPSKD
jgi:hypothetical protein